MFAKHYQTIYALPTAQEVDASMTARVSKATGYPAPAKKNKNKKNKKSWYNRKGKSIANNDEGNWRRPNNEALLEDARKGPSKVFTRRIVFGSVDSSDSELNSDGDASSASGYQPPQEMKKNPWLQDGDESFSLFAYDFLADYQNKTAQEVKPQLSNKEIGIAIMKLITPSAK